MTNVLRNSPVGSMSPESTATSDMGIDLSADASLLPEYCQTCWPGLFVSDGRKWKMKMAYKSEDMHLGNHNQFNSNATYSGLSHFILVRFLGLFLAIAADTI